MPPTRPLWRASGPGADFLIVGGPCGYRLLCMRRRASGRGVSDGCLMLTPDVAASLRDALGAISPRDPGTPGEGGADR